MPDIFYLSFYKQFIDSNTSDCKKFTPGSMPDISDFSRYQKKIKNNNTIPSSSATDITSFSSTQNRSDCKKFTHGLMPDISKKL